jgi:hypothetical protein
MCAACRWAATPRSTCRARRRPRAESGPARGPGCCWVAWQLAASDCTMEPSRRSKADNPFAAFTLIRWYAENAVAVLYAKDYPHKVVRLLGLNAHQMPVGRLTAHAERSPALKSSRLSTQCSASTPIPHRNHSLCSWRRTQPRIVA